MMNQLENFWEPWADELAAAYSESAGNLRFRLVTEALQIHLPQGSKRIVDVGGGYGLQAIMLARLGHEVVIVDPDPGMIEIAQKKVSRESEVVRDRIRFFVEYGQYADRLGLGEFDLVCCHSVLMYLRDPSAVLLSLSRMCRFRGIVSLLTINPESIGFREGLLRNWSEAIRFIRDPDYIGRRYRPNVKHTLSKLTGILEENGCELLASYGVGVFGDHIGVAIDDQEFDEIYKLEWLAGCTSPYREVARSSHAIYLRSK